MENLATAISSQNNKNLTSMWIVVNENNKILKVQGRVTNYQMLAQNLTMMYDEYGDYEYFAFEHTTEEVTKEIIRMQVVKAEQ